MGKKVLLADKSATIHKLVEMHLNDSGYELKTVSTGKEAVAAIPEFQPDVILVDALLEVHHYEVCNHVRGQGDATPVILLIGRFQPFSDDDAEASRAAGITRILKKPFAQDQLIAVINELVPDEPDALEEREQAPDFQTGDFGAPPKTGYDDGATVQFSPEALQASIGSVDLDANVPSMDAFAMDDDDAEVLDDDDVEELDSGDMEDLDDEDDFGEDETMDLGTHDLADVVERREAEAVEAADDERGWPESDAPTMEVEREPLGDNSAETGDLAAESEEGMGDTGDLEEDGDGSFADIGDFESADLVEDDLGSDGFSEDFGTDVGFDEENLSDVEAEDDSDMDFDVAEAEDEDALDTEPMSEAHESVDVDLEEDEEPDFDAVDLDDQHFDMESDTEPNIDISDAAGLDTDPDLGAFEAADLEADEELVEDDGSFGDDLDDGLPADEEAEDELEVDDVSFGDDDLDAGEPVDLDAGEPLDDDALGDVALEADDAFGADESSEEISDFEMDDSADDFSAESDSEDDDFAVESDSEDDDFAVESDSEDDDFAVESDSDDNDFAVESDSDEVDFNVGHMDDLDGDALDLDDDLPAADEIHSLELDEAGIEDDEDASEDSFSDMSDFSGDAEDVDDDADSDRVPLDMMPENDEATEEDDEYALDNQGNMDATVDLSAGGVPMSLPSTPLQPPPDVAETVGLERALSPDDVEIEDPAESDGDVLTDLDEVQPRNHEEADTMGSYEVEEIEPELIGDDPVDTMDSEPDQNDAIAFPDEDEILDAEAMPASEMPTEELDSVLEEDDDDPDEASDDLDEESFADVDPDDTVAVEPEAELDLDPEAEPEAQEPFDDEDDVDLDLDPEPEPLPVADPPAHQAEPMALTDPDPVVDADAPEPAAAPSAAPAQFSGEANLTDAQLDQLAEKVAAKVAEKVAAQLIEKLGEEGIRDIVWQVVPELAEAMIKKRVFQLEQAVDEE